MAEVEAARDLIVIGGGIGGSAAALRAAQYSLRVAWIRGDADTARRSRAQWVVNIDNMIGVHPGVIVPKILKLLSAPEHAAAREKVEGAHLHIGTRDLVDNTVDRIRAELGEHVELVDAAAEHARRNDDGSFTVEVAGRSISAPAIVLSTGVMDRQPSIKKARAGVLVDQPSWIYPFANRESVLYCIRCEGHLTAESCVAVIGSSESAAELAMMLHERYGSACAVVTNGEAPTWSASAAEGLAAYGLPVHTARIVDVEGKKGALHTLTLEDGTELAVQFALVALGLHRVYNDLARELGAELTNPEEPPELRHVAIDERGETSVHGLFAVGDLSRHRDRSVMKQVYTAQEYAVRAVDVVEARVRKQRRARALAAYRAGAR